MFATFFFIKHMWLGKQRKMPEIHNCTFLPICHVGSHVFNLCDRTMLTSGYSFSEKNYLQTLNYNLHALWEIKANLVYWKFTPAGYNSTTILQKKVNKSRNPKAFPHLFLYKNWKTSLCSQSPYQNSSDVCWRFIAATIQGHF